MTLFLVQHGKAKPATEDPERSLTEQGAEVVRDTGSRIGMPVALVSLYGVTPAWGGSSPKLDCSSESGALN